MVSGNFIIWYLVRLALELFPNIWASAINLWALRPAKSRKPQKCILALQVTHRAILNKNNNNNEKKIGDNQQRIQLCLSTNLWQTATTSVTAKW